MPQLTYSRKSYAVRITAEGDKARIEVTRPGGVRRHTLVPRRIVDRAARGSDRAFFAAAAPMLPKRTAPQREWVPGIERFTIEVGDRSWAAIAFERAWGRRATVVRISPVRPRVLQETLAFPLRILESVSSTALALLRAVKAGLPTVVERALDTVFGRAFREQAVVVAQSPLADAERFVRDGRWATVDLLHVHGFTPGPAALSTAPGEDPATAGGLLRFAERFQTRLIVIGAEAAHLPALRVLAQGIVERAGPAVWLFDAARSPGWDRIYADIVHDRPLDWIQHHAGGELFAGAGGEEALRYSGIAGRLSRPAERAAITRLIAQSTPAPRRTPAERPRLKDVEWAFISALDSMGLPRQGTRINWQDLSGTRAERLGDLIGERLTEKRWLVPGLDRFLAGESRRARSVSLDAVFGHVSTHGHAAGALQRAALRRMASQRMASLARSLRGYQFENRESDGMLPLAGKISSLLAQRKLLRGPAAGARGRRTPPPRQVQTSFSVPRPGGGLDPLPQKSARLVPGALVHFCVRVAPKDTRLVTLGDATFLEEQVQWEGDGAWIEVGVTAIDFDLIGDPVQQVWLPREGPTPVIAFAVRPRRKTTIPGVARLRVSLFHRNNLIQSFIVGARLRGWRATPGPLARALGAGLAEVQTLGPLGYLQRLEYATASIAEAATLPARGLTIVANDSAGEKIVTVKSDDVFDVTIDPLLPDKVKAARHALDVASRVAGGSDYRYMFGGQANDGDPATLFEALENVAREGFGIFNTLVRKPEDQQRVRAVLDAGPGIHAAHIDPAGIVPWPMIYDRLFRPVKQWSPDWTDPRAPRFAVQTGLCPASRPAPDGGMPAACGGAGCLLNAADNDRRKQAGEAIYLEESVVCLRRFWGFLRPIEMPPEQSTGLRRTDGQRRPTDIAAGTPPKVVGGFNPELRFAARHEADLDANVFAGAAGAPPRAALVRPAVAGPEPLRQLLEQTDPDIVYFFCHALASLTDTAKQRTLGPSLDFGNGFKGAVEDVLEASEFAGRAWTHAPLVFINGCGSAGFVPYAPSEFIGQFINGRKASAVIGAEVTIWEVLAAEVARLFFASFLDGKPAGESLLLARRALLARNNPLGLVYSLYGSADVRLKP